MSLQRSAGDLVPQDIAEILARERRGMKGRKHRGGSLGRAFRWLKSRRKKKRVAGGGTNGTAGMAGDARAGKPGHQHGHDVAKGLLKQEEESRPCLSPLYPENVFIEGDRPQFLQDLHTEAQEGLKIQQQEENGMDYQDDESVVSTVTLQTGDGTSLADSMRTVGSGGTTTDAMSTVSGVSAVSTVSAVSAVSAVSEVSAASTVSTRSSRSTRSGLTRQGSTFKPLSGGKRSEKSRRRSKRATVAGIPQHVKRELGLDRGPWQRSPTEDYLPNGEGVVTHMEEVDALPDPGGTPEGVRVHLEALEGLESAEEQQLQRHHMQALYLDDLAVARSAGPRLSPRRRPRSVLVPGVIAKAAAAPPAGGSPSEVFPPSPVMYVSPQATYLSKIIPNAVLPGDVDVIEISRKGRSRGSVRTLSRSSLAAPSPALSQKSWSGSESDSSHTMVSDSSTISSGGGRGRGRRGKQESSRQVAMASPTSPDQVSLHSSISCTSNITSVSQQGNGPFGRSLSVKKSKKNPPAPPRRTNSLHPGKLRRHSRDTLDAPLQSSSPAYSADQSSSSSSSTVASMPALAQPAVVQGSGFHTTLSPSSGYSSQNPTPTVSPYSGNPPTPAPGTTHQRALLVLPKTSPLMAAFLGYGAPPGIPPHPKVMAPTPPPPETWIHDQRSFDLLIGPVAVQRNLFVALQKVRLDRQRKSASEPARCPLGAGNVQKKAPPPVMKKSGSVKMEVLKHASPAVMMKMHKQTPPPSPPPSHNPPPPPAKETPPSSVSGPQHLSETDSAWPLPPPPPVEMLPGSVFEGQDEADYLPPPPLQDGAGSPPVQANVQRMTPLVTATPTSVTMESRLPPVHTQQLTQEVASPASLVTATMVTMPNDTRKVPQASVQPDPPTPQPSRTKNSSELPLLLKEVPPLAQETLYLLQGIPPPPKEPPPPPPEAPPVLQPTLAPTPNVLPPPTEAAFAILEIPPPPQEAPPLPPEVPSVSPVVPAPAQEAPPPPKEAPSVPLGVLPPLQDFPPFTQGIPPPPREAPPPPPEVSSASLVVPVPTQEAPPSPKEAPSVPQQVLPPPQEVPPVALEVQPPTQEAIPAPEEVPPPPQEVTSVLQEVMPPPQEPQPVPKEVLPAPNEASPVLQEVLPPPLEVTPVPQEVLPPAQEGPPVLQEVLPPPQEVPPVPQEVLPPPQEVPPVPQEVLPPAQEGPPVLQEVLPPLQEVTPVPQEVLPPAQEGPSVLQEVLLPAQEVLDVAQEVLPPTQEAPPVPEEVQTSVLVAPTAAPPPPPVEEQTPPTCPLAEPDPVNQEPPREPQPKSSPTPNREARMPMTTSALLQMVRMRANEPRDAGAKPERNQSPADGPDAAQRPDTLPLKAPSPAVKYPPPSAGPAPSMRLQEAIRMKTAAMSRVGPRSPRSASPSPSPSPSSPSPASTASFIFAKSSRKVVIETPSSPQAGLRGKLAAELAWISAPAKTSNDQKKPAKVPPPVAKKPGHHTPSDQDPPTTPEAIRQQSQDRLTREMTENGGVNTPAKETPTEEDPAKENAESLNASPGGGQAANKGQVSVPPTP